MKNKKVKCYICKQKLPKYKKKFCSKKCSYNYHLIRKYKKLSLECLNCKKIFKPKRIKGQTNKFCSLKYAGKIVKIKKI